MIACGSAAADPQAVLRAAQGSFADMPTLAPATACPGSAEARYCTTPNVIFLDQTDAAGPLSAYRLAHLMGHAAQVRHGVADVALAAINADRSREAVLRGMVTRQVECIAGVLWHRAGLPPTDLRSLVAAEPFTHAHWGRTPVDRGPQVSIGLDARAYWFKVGQGGRLASCHVGAMSSDLLVVADRWPGAQGVPSASPQRP